MRKAYLAIICLFTGFNAFAQHTDIQPVPQQISESGQLITLPGSYQFTGDTEANPYAVQQLKQLLAGNHSAKEGLRIYIGEKGDKAIRKFARRIPNQKEGYYLCINDKEIVLAGNDERGTFYALQTLSRLLKDNHPLPRCSGRILWHSVEPCRSSAPTQILWRKQDEHVYLRT